MEVWEKMKHKIAIATLIPLFLVLLLFSNSINYVNADDVSQIHGSSKDVYVNYTYSSGSWAIFEIEQSGLSSIGDLKAEWTLIDSNGNVVYNWVHTPDEYHQNPITGAWTAKDKFEIQIPCMFFKEAGEWRVDAHFKADISDFNPYYIHFHINVEKGSFVDNLFAPIYVYNNPNIGGIQLGYIQFKLFPIGYIVSAILIILFAILLIRYMKEATKAGSEIIKKSRQEIRESWKKSSER